MSDLVIMELKTESGKIEYLVVDTKGAPVVFRSENKDEAVEYKRENTSVTSREVII